MRRDSGIDERFAAYVRARRASPAGGGAAHGDWHAAEDLVQAPVLNPDKLGHVGPVGDARAFLREVLQSRRP